MADTLKADICVIGGGKAGLEAAMTAMRAGKQVVLVERGALGGQHLHTACIPTEVLTATAGRAAAMQSTRQMGISPAVPLVDFTAMGRNIARTQSALAEHHTADRLAALGIELIQAPATFLDETSLQAGDYQVTAETFTIATGSYQAVPAIPGIDHVPCLTTDTLFTQNKRIDSLIVYGGTPWAVEIAQAFARLGSKVTLIDPAPLLSDFDSEAVALVREALASAGVAIYEAAQIVRADRAPNLAASVTLELSGETQTVEASELFLCAGNVPNVDSINVAAGGIDADALGVRVNRHLQTSNRRVYAIGDVLGSAYAMPGALTAALGTAQARAVVARALDRSTESFNPHLVPRIVRSDPQIAAFGLSEDRAREKHGSVDLRRFPLAETGYATAIGKPEGFLKVIATPSGTILGATAVGTNAEAALMPLVLAARCGLGIDDIARMPTPTPSIHEASSAITDTLLYGGSRNPWYRKTFSRLPGVR